MEKQRKLIGIMISQPDDYYQSHLLTPLLEDFSDANYDVAVFSTSVKSCELSKFGVGEGNIFNIINYSLFDAFIIVPDTIQIDGVVDKLCDDIRNNFSDVKVSIDTQVDGFQCIISDDTVAVESITDHLIEEHNYSDILMITGIAGHQHAINRANGYMNSMKKHHLEDKIKVLNGSFWFNDGVDFIDDIVVDGKLKYEAIVCSVPQGAIGVCDEIEKRGFKIPEDIAVVCHDLVDSITYKTALSGTKIPTKHTAHRASHFVISQLEGREVAVPKEIVNIYPNTSCGCVPENAGAGVVKYTDLNFKTAFFSTFNFMMEDLIADKNFDDFIEHADWYSYQLGDIYTFGICLCTDWAGPLNQDNEYRIQGYSNEMQLKSLRKDGGLVAKGILFDKSEMFPDMFTPREYPTAYYFAPLHFNDRCFGYAVVSYGPNPVVYADCFRHWMRNLNNALESFRMKNNLRLYSNIINNNAITDALTGIGNRLSFDEFSMNIVHGTKVCVIIGDLNRLKYINDTFGHLEGDFAIKTCADVFRHATENACKDCLSKCFRYGGDEFVLVAVGDCSFEIGDSFEEEIHSYLNFINENKSKDYDVSVTLGCKNGIIDSETTFAQILSAADKNMLQKKKDRKIFRD